jgi:hypothetical protein
MAEGFGPPDELGQQPRLAHPGVTGQQHAGWPTGGSSGQRRGQLRELGAPPDQLDPDPQPCHIADRGTRDRQF